MAQTLSEREPARPSPASGGVRLVIGMLAVMWAAWLVNALDHYHLDVPLGIQPRNVSHLWGILTAPFIHASFTHILSNTVPFLILGSVIALAGWRRVAVVTGVTILISGLGVWLVAGAATTTVGASGVVFGFATYLMGRGFFSRRLVEIAVGVIVGALFGLSLLGDLIPHAHVSWQDHLFGAIGGVLAAAWLSRRAAQPTAALRPGSLARRPR